MLILKRGQVSREINEVFELENAHMAVKLELTDCMIKRLFLFNNG
jgi:hypothetical protein